MIKGALKRSAVGTVGVDDLDRLPFVQTSRAAAPCRYNLKICRLIAILLPLAHLPRRDHPCWTTRKRVMPHQGRRTGSNGLRRPSVVFAFAAHHHRARTTPLAMGARHTRCEQLMWRSCQRTSEVPIRRGANAACSTG